MLCVPTIGHLDVEQQGRRNREQQGTTGNNGEETTGKTGKGNEKSVTVICLNLNLFSTGKEKMYNPQECKILMEYFSQVSPTLENCRKFLSSHSSFSRRTPKSIQDKVRYLQKQ